MNLTWGLCLFNSVDLGKVHSLSLSMICSVFISYAHIRTTAFFIRTLAFKFIDTITILDHIINSYMRI